MLSRMDHNRACSGDPIPPSYPGNSNHAERRTCVACPACGRQGIAKWNARGMSPPHGWWIGKKPPVFNNPPTVYCSSECIAQVEG